MDSLKKYKMVLCPTPDDQEGYRLDVNEMEVVARFDSFEAMPDDWHEDQMTRGSGKWFVEDGCLWCDIEVQEPSVMWYDHAIPGSHAIAYRGAAIPGSNRPIADAGQIGELNTFWNSSGDSGPPDGDWSLTLSGFYGWYTGFSGIEYVKGTGAKDAPAGHVVAHQLELQSSRNYDIFCGRFGTQDFQFVDGAAVMQAQAGFPRLPESHVGVGTFGDIGNTTIIRIEEIIIFRIPDPDEGK